MLAQATRQVNGFNMPKSANPFKLVAVDMDGTLLNDKYTVSEYTRGVLARLLARGVHIVFATGRPFTDVKRIKRKLNIFTSSSSTPTSSRLSIPCIPSPCTDLPPNGTGVNGSVKMENVMPSCFAITSNGACIYDEMNQLVREQYIDPRICRELYSMFSDDPEVNINVFRGLKHNKVHDSSTSLSDEHIAEDDDEWISRYPSDLEAARYHQSNFTFRVVSDPAHNFPTDHVTTIFFLCYNFAKTAPIEEAINARMAGLKSELHLEETIRVAPSSQNCLDVIPEKVSKASALEYVAAQVGTTMADCIAFGDGLNDLELLQSVGKGCIMGNANPRLKKALPHLEVIGHNNEDGVARKLAEVFKLN